MCSNIEISLVPPRSHHARFHFPGEFIEGRIFLTGLIPNTLYTVLVRHLGLTHLVLPGHEGQNDDSGQADFTEQVCSNPVCMFQFMCLAHDQWEGMPQQAKDNIKMHIVPKEIESCQVIETFELSLSPKSPNSIKSRFGSCQNFVEVRCFSSEFGFQKALFPICVRRTTLVPLATKTKEASVGKPVYRGNSPKSGQPHNSEGCYTWETNSLDDEQQTLEGQAQLPLGLGQMDPLLDERKVSRSKSTTTSIGYHQASGCCLPQNKVSITSLKAEGDRQPTPGIQCDTSATRMSYCVKLAKSCRVAQNLLIEGTFQLSQTPEACLAPGPMQAEVWVELACQVIAHIETDSGSKSNSGNPPNHRECIVKARWNMGQLIRSASTDSSALGEQQSLQLKVPIAMDHPTSGFQNWVGQSEREHTFGTFDLEVHPPILDQTPPIQAPQEPRSRNMLGRREDTNGSLPRKWDSKRSSLVAPNHLRKTRHTPGLDGSSIYETTSENESKAERSWDDIEAKFERNLDEDRKLKMLQTTSALTPTNSILDSNDQGFHSSSSHGSKNEPDMEGGLVVSMQRFLNMEQHAHQATNSSGTVPAGPIPLDLTASHKRTRQFRNVFLGLLKMRYAAGDRSVVNYKKKAIEDPPTWTEKSNTIEAEGPSAPTPDSALSSDSYSTKVRGPTALKRRIQRKRSKGGNLISMHHSPTRIRLRPGWRGNNGHQAEGKPTSDLTSFSVLPELERLKSGEMSLCSDLEEGPQNRFSPFQAQPGTTIFQHKQMTYHQSLPGSILDLKIDSQAVQSQSS